MAPKRKRDQGATYSRMDVWARGMIWGLSLMCASRDQICEAVLKRDGTAPTVRAVDDVIAKKKAEPEWRGEEVHSGRPQIFNSLPATTACGPGFCRTRQGQSDGQILPQTFTVLAQS